MALVSHAFIHGRQDFFRVLAEALERGERLQQTFPDDERYGVICDGLAAINSMTADDREPSKEQRRGSRVGLFAGRAFEASSTVEADLLCQQVLELEWYFKLWPSDAAWNALDDDDFRIFYPDDYAP